MKLHFKRCAGMASRALSAVCRGKGMLSNGLCAGAFIRPYRSRAAVYLFWRLLQYGISLLPPLCYLLFLNEVIMKGRIDFLWAPFLLYVLTYAGAALTSVCQKRAYNRVFPVMALEWKGRMLEQYARLDIQRLQAYTAGERKLRLHNDTENAALYWEKTLEAGVLSAGALVTAGILLSLNWILALCSFALLPVSFWVTRLIRGRSSREYERERRLLGSWQDFMLHNLFFWKEVRTDGQQERQEKRFGALWKEMGQASLRAHMYWFCNRTFLAFKDVFLTRMGLYLLGGILVINGMAALPALLAFVEYYGNFADRLLELADIALKRGEQERSLERIGEIMALSVAKRPHQMEAFESLRCDRLTFAYEENQESVLRDFSLEVKKGEKVAIVGESGCGKSTLIKLLAGCLEPVAGEVFWNGQPAAQTDRASLYRRVGFLMQEGSLFNLTIRENLTFAKADASNRELEDACRRANILDFIQTLPLGFETVIGENGIRLSGGQRQRLLIASLFLQDPEVIIFDEATSSLDYQNESEILRLLTEQMGEKTLIMVTHRKTALTNCDRVIIMD